MSGEGKYALRGREFQFSDGLRGRNLAAVVYGSNGSGECRLLLNIELITLAGRGLVLSWARREIARGTRVSWLLGDELADLA